ncbi:MAG: TetR/AcrR family transcriptional regulator [Gordonia sp. (in: high G+C Gram-positive bacteria)]|nr:MAG: TetR/AcrR family transcriptional regulator [Gordonia sp. (in: high G+C Gram-positive bacteria)]
MFGQSVTVITQPVKTSLPAAESLTPRGRKTRDALLDAARVVFEEVGFLDTRVEHIAQAASVSYGTFYRYFESKDAVFWELSTRLFEDIHRRNSVDDKVSPAQRLIDSNRAYYQAYRRNAKLMAIVEQVATFNTDFRRLRHEHRRELIERSARAIARWQDDGDVSATLDPELAARSLAAMVDHTLYLWLVQGEDADEKALLDTLDQMCLGALGLNRP